MKNYIGIDLGGTNIRVGLVSEDGKIINELKQLTEAHLGNDQIVSKIVSMVKEITKNVSFSGIGIGTPGLIDHYNGVIVSAANLKFNNFPLRDRVAEHFDVPVVIANDANVAALAEAYFGAGKGMKIVQYITISTGIGGGLVINKKIVAGKNGCCGEIGNLIIDNEQFEHPLFNDGAFELNASGSALNKKVQAISPYMNASDLFKNAKVNADLKKIYDKFIDDTARALSLIAHIVDPDIFIIGGGVSQSFEYFHKDLQEAYKKYIFDFMSGSINIAKAKLDDPGIIGASMLVLNKN